MALNFLSEAGALLEQNLKRQLTYSYFPRNYDGIVKPVNGGNFSGAYPKNYKGNLYNDVSVHIRVGNNPNAQVTTNDILNNQIQFIIDFGDNDYWYYVDQGRKPGIPFQKKRQGGVSRTGKALPRRSKKTGRFLKNAYYISYTSMPPLKDIQEWVAQKPALVNPELSLNTRTYLAMRSIARDGIYGINFVQNAIDETIQDLSFAGEQVISEWFEKTVANFPIIKQGKTKIYDLGGLGTL